jgi:hypothetical protein
MNPKAKLHCQNLLLKYGSPTPFKGSDGQFHYLYLSYHKSSYKFYIGKHSSNDYETDDYTGSGKRYKLALNKHGRDAFEHHILAFFNTPEEAYAKEAEEVTIEMIDREFKGLMYNLKAGGYGLVGLSSESKKKRSASISANLRYRLEKDNIFKEDITRKDLLYYLKDGYRFTDLTTLVLYHPQVNLKHMGIANGYVGISKKRSKDNFERDIIEFLEKGFIIGYPPKNFNPLENIDVSDVKKILKNRQNRSRVRISRTLKTNTTYSLIKGEYILEVSRFKVLSLLKDLYRFTQVSVQICNKEGKHKPHRFESKDKNYDREKQHLKLIELLESGEWQLGKVWEELGGEEKEETEPVIEEPVEKVMERKREYCKKRGMESLF